MERIDTVIPTRADALGLSGIDPTLELESEIERLKNEKNAIILAHYYQDGDIQDLADFVGDSLDLSRKAADTDADTIVFCGVKFMAEVAKILSPEKTVLLPDAEAGCSLEDSCPPRDFKAFREAHPDHVSVTYINCSAEVKACSDIIVTSSNAVDVINSIAPDKPILFAPDRHLGTYLAKKSGRDMLLWQGSCIVHEQFSERELIKLQSQYPHARTAAHPECHDGILKHADHVGSTRSILEYVTSRPEDIFLIATEPHIIHQMEKSAPAKQFIGVPGQDGGCNCNNCPFMELNTLEKLYLCLLNGGPAIHLPEDLRQQAVKPLQRMLELSKGVPLKKA